MSKQNDTSKKPSENPTDKKDPKDTSSTPADKQPDPAKEPEKTEEKTFTQADIDAAVAAAVAAAKKEADKEAAKQKEREQLSKEERLELELEDIRRENLMMKAENAVVEALKEAGARSPNLLFAAIRNNLEFKDGKLTNLTEIVESLKKSYADQFGEKPEDKPNESIDAGKGQNTDKDRPETLNGALKAYYKK